MVYSRQSPPDGRFFVNNVPVKQGSNTITMVVNAFGVGGYNATTNTYVAALEQSYTVTSTALQPILVDVNPTEQFISANQNATINVTLSKQGAVSLGYIRLALLQPNGTEQMIMDVQGSSFTDDQARVQITLSGLGQRTLIATVYDAQSVQVQRSTVIVMLRDAHEQAARIKAVIDAFRQKLANNDVAGIGDFFTGTIRTEHAAIINQMTAVERATVAVDLANMSKIVMSNQRYARLYVERAEAGGTFSYIIYLIRDDDGMWRIDEM
jgi:hypothetical protein